MKIYEKITYKRKGKIIGYMLIYGSNAHFVLADSEMRIIENIDYKKVIDSGEFFRDIASHYFEDCKMIDKKWLISNRFLVLNAKPILSSTEFMGSKFGK